MVGDVDGTDAVEPEAGPAGDGAGAAVAVGPAARTARPLAPVASPVSAQPVSASPAATSSGVSRVTVARLIVAPR